MYDLDHLVQETATAMKEIGDELRLLAGILDLVESDSNQHWALSVRRESLEDLHYYLMEAFAGMRGLRPEPAVLRGLLHDWAVWRRPR